MSDENSVPAPTRALLTEDGYGFCTRVRTEPSDYDRQGHLNNAAIAGMFNDVRSAYVLERIGSEWTDMMRDHDYVVAARELHVLYESEGMPGERFVGAMRYTRREGKAAIIEERLVDAATARPVARAWVVQLLARSGRAIDWPDRYFELVAAIEGRPVEWRPSRARAPFGPPK